MKVEIWSDILCPFCYIGKRQFDAALQEFGRKDGVEVVLRSFELMPDAPVESDRDMHAMIADKLGVGYAQGKALNDEVVRLAATVGLAYDLDRAHPTNSRDAHRLVHLAAKDGRGARMIERLYAAHFVESTNIGKPENLKTLASEVGLVHKEVESLLAGDAYVKDVRADEAEARSLGIAGVPFFVFDRRHGVSGAQPPEVFLEALDKAWAERVG